MIFNELAESLEGEIKKDLFTKRAYSVDASIFEIEPLAVAIPKTAADIRACAAWANKHSIPLIPRGAATGITGGCIGSGLIVDCSVYMNKILSIDPDRQLAVVEPGVVQDALNHALMPFNLRLGPDTSTGNRATIGGMAANNAAGSHSLKYGTMRDALEEVELLLSSGEVIILKPLGENEWREKLSLPTEEGAIYRTLENLRVKKRKEIEQGFPKLSRRVSGFNLDALIKEWPLNPCELFAGSEGALGIATKFTLKLAPRLKKTTLCILPVTDIPDAAAYVPKLLSFSPTAVELIDSIILKSGIPTHGKLPWLPDIAEGLIIVEFEEGQENNRDALIHASKPPCFGKAILLEDPAAIASLWVLRKSGLGLLLSKRSYSRAIAFIEDVAIHPNEAGPFLKELFAYLKKKEKSAGIYGHLGPGCLHIRPYIDMRASKELALMQEIMQHTADLLLKYRGALSGEHGDGLIRSWLNRKMFGNNLYEAFKQVKSAFDPAGIMNPGKVVNDTLPIQHLRLSPETPIRSIPTFLDFSQEGGFELSADLCNGNAECRKQEGLMCPSFQATGKEFETTRARAQALRSIIHGQAPVEAFTSKALHDILDLCLQCKGCKSECPSHVDMAKMKTEFLYQYQEKHGYSLRSRFFAHASSLSKIGSLAPGLSNFLATGPFGKWLLKGIRVVPDSLPTLAPVRFSKTASSDTEGDVVLFIDTFTEFHHPEIGKAALSVLQRLGLSVICPPFTCCGRPLLSKGFLKQARKQAHRLIEMLYPYALKSLPIVGLEPSCIQTIAEDLDSLLKDSIWKEKAARIAACCCSFDQFMAKQFKEKRLQFTFPKKFREALVHIHCYQKHHGIESAMQTLFQKVIIMQTGCCGMAGSFGYEAEHQAISLSIGNLALFPAVSASSQSAAIIANGTSCRSQIARGTKRTALHLAELLAQGEIHEFK